jgi:hypothetical protein
MNFHFYSTTATPHIFFKKNTSYANARDIYVYVLSEYHKGSTVATLRMAKGTTQRVALQQRRFLPRSNFLPP